jgi:hypothetical protein
VNEETVMPHRERRSERGVVMFITVLLLAMMGGLGLAALDSATRDRETAGFYNREASAFYAADAGVQHARAVVKQLNSPFDAPAFPVDAAPAQIGDTSLYYAWVSGGGALPSYYGDPAFPVAVRQEGMAQGVCDGDNFQRQALPTLWRINVVGQGPDGATARIEAKEAKCFFGVGGSRY